MVTKLREIFEKPVDRAIEGVIKADDEASLRVELEEYVITNEIAKQLERFLDAYNNYQTANGVWISGFFGSGKSHLLKILALLLENRQVDGTTALDLFISKCADNEILSADLKRAVAIPSKSILFNIDQKADVIVKTQLDALLSVFQKVFDEMCGYYGKQAHIAQFERDLDSRSIYQPFKVAYQRIANRPWERGREQSLLEGSNIAKAYAEAARLNEGAAQGILTNYRNEYKVSIEDFAQKVKDFIDTQQAGFRLNFFVDEVGQYIAENVKLMTNLQTIAESLNTKCRGRAWIIVTSQQDMEAVVGELRPQANDFSKIMARFANRVPLTSADVAEVIQKRLLRKTEAGIAALSDLHHREANNLKTLFDFADGSIRLKNFEDRDQFIHSYPFIPYQYPLFQMAIQNLSQHNAFEGKNSSVGERSMLGVFQEVAIHLADLPLGEIATFEMMFEGIRSALKSSVQQSIQVAERNLGNPFAVRVLKALFLVKYVKPFKSTVRNISILMLERFDQDPVKHKRRMEEALSLLEQNTYIQRNGDLFEFLTDEEKDVEQEIKAIDIDSSEVSKELEALIFDAVIKSRKIRHEKASHEYPYARRLDDRLLGRDYELAINVISAFHENSGAADAIRMKSMSTDELTILLKSDDRFVADLMMYKRTDKYVRQARSTAQQPAIERIISDKGAQNVARHRDLTSRAKLLVAEAQLFVRGEELEIRSQDAQQRIERAFQTLVDKVHTNLGMLRGVAYSESDIGRYLRHGADGMFGAEGASLTEAEQEILNFAQANVRTGVRTTVKAIVEKFEGKPYGWPYAAILCTVAGLFGRGKLEARIDGTLLEGEALEKALKNAHALSNMVLDLQVEFSPAQVRNLKEFYKDFFDTQPASSDAKALGIETGVAFSKLLDELSGLVELRGHYPFMSTLEPVVATAREASGKTYGWYLTDLGKHGEKLLDAKAATLDPIRRFMSGAQKKIYDHARAFFTEQQSNFSYVDESQAAAIRTFLEDVNCFKGSAIQQLKETVDRVHAAVRHKLTEERAGALADFDDLKAKLEAIPEFKVLDGARRADIAARIDAALTPIKEASLIAMIRERSNTFRTATYPELLARVTAPADKPSPTSPPGGTGGGTGETGLKTGASPPPKQQPRTEYISGASVKVSFDKPFLSNEHDVDAYLKSMREALLMEIRIGKRITV